MLGKEAAIPYGLIRTGDRKRIPYYLREFNIAARFGTG